MALISFDCNISLKEGQEIFRAAYPLSLILFTELSSKSTTESMKSEVQCSSAGAGQECSVQHSSAICIG